MAASIMTAPAAQAANAWDDSRQMVVIISADWAAKTGQLQRYSRSAASQAWHADGDPIPVALGKTGMAWGRGLHAQISDGPQKHEGDGKTPAGVFRLPVGFGYADANDAGVKRLKLSYVSASPGVQCVDDAGSTHYNRIVDRAQVKQPDWNSAEDMRRKDDLYRWGVVVDHNSERVAGAGSCVFLHVWRAAGSPTVGCSAMSPQAMQELLAWLDASTKPVLVQLPQSEYVKRKAGWRLPQ